MPNVLPAQTFDTLSAAVGVLTAMITPALLISASGTYILSTSNRLGRVVDRVRTITDRLDTMVHSPTTDMLEERCQMLKEQMAGLRVRATLLQRILTIFYSAAGLFMLTSVAIGLDALFDRHNSLHWLPVALGLAGASALLYGSIMLIREARMAVSSLRQEMEFFDSLMRLGGEKGTACGDGTKGQIAK